MAGEKMNNSTEINCPCQDAPELTVNIGINNKINEFLKLRNKCPALKLGLPDDLIDKHINHIATNKKDRSMFFTAFVWGPDRISRLTAPIHKYILDENQKIRRPINDGYLNSLREPYPINNEITVNEDGQQEDEWEETQQGKAQRGKAHEAMRIYAGKLYELIFADFLETAGYKIKDLEAWNKDAPDIYASKKEAGEEQNFLLEVKCIFQETYAAVNLFYYGRQDEGVADYLLGKTCEAAQKLRTFNGKEKYRGKKIIVIIYDRMERDNFQRAMELYNPNNPMFYNKENAIKIFTQNKNTTNSKRNEIEQLFNNPDEYIQSNDEVWIYGISYGGPINPELMRKYDVCGKSI